MLEEAQMKRIEAQRKLFVEMERLRYPKNKDMSDWDRKIMLDAAVADLWAEWQTYLALEERIKLEIPSRTTN